MWFIFALVTMLFWGGADLMYKKGAVESDKYSHLKTSIAVGLVMGIHAFCMLLFGNINYDFRNIIVYLPVSMMYILSMTIGYFGLRYLELSISSPIQNASGAVSCILCLIFLGQRLDVISTFGVILICLGVIVLGIIEKKMNDDPLTKENKKYKIGFVAFFMPILYCIIDSLGTFFDAYYLDDVSTTPLLNVTENTLENVANVSYELSFFIVAVILFIFVKFIKKQSFKITDQKDRLGAAVLETGGQFFYVYAMSGNGVIAAPMIASYCIVSIILSRFILKEKLEKNQYLSVLFVILGILMLGISEGLAE